MNDSVAGIVAVHPDRFSWFATLPPSDVMAPVADIDRLDPHEAVLMPNVADVHFGHPDLDPALVSAGRPPCGDLLPSQRTTRHQRSSVAEPLPLVERHRRDDVQDLWHLKAGLQ